jgi:hypothetical protein
LEIIVGKSTASVEDRFWAKVDAFGVCWEWTGTKTYDGYGTFRPQYDGVVNMAHRFAWETLVGPIPDGLELDHLCRNTLCVNPDHLEPVTQAENNRRSYSVSGVNARKTHCKYGHEFTPENTYVQWNRGRQGRRCKTCHRESVNERARRRREATQQQA